MRALWALGAFLGFLMIIWVVALSSRRCGRRSQGSYPASYSSRRSLECSTVWRRRGWVASEARAKRAGAEQQDKPPSAPKRM